MKHTLCSASLSIVVLASVLCATAIAGENLYFDSDGVKIRYRVLGSGTPVILVHGYTGDFDGTWPSVIDVLTPHFQVIGLDARGHGKSGKPHDTADYGIRMVIDVANLMDHLGIDRAHVAGYSMGGIITLKMASIYPDRLYSAVTGGNGMFTQEELQTIGKGHSAVMQQAIDDQIPVSHFLADALEDSWTAQSGEKEFPPVLKKLHEDFRSLDNDPHALIAVVQSLSRMAISEGDAAAIHVPLLAICGSLDDPFKTVDRLEAAAPDTEVIIIEGEDHLTTFVAPAFAEALRDFFLRIKG